MPHLAQAYVASVIAIGGALSIWAFQGDIPLYAQWLPFLSLLGLALLVEVYRTDAPGNMSHSALVVLEFAGLLLLHPAFFVLLVTITLGFDWTRARLTNSTRLRQCYKQPFNISMTLIAGFAALGWGYLLTGEHLNPRLYSTLLVFAVGSAALIQVGTNHLLLRLVIVLAQGLPLRELKKIDRNVIRTDFLLLLMGYIVAILWTLHPLLILLSLSPLFLVYRALMIPNLEQKAHMDGKTGLLNAQHFMEQATQALERTQRQKLPLSVLMADLDLLRNINNQYGHLAGDTVLTGIGKVIRETLRDSDVAGRFGGEEFAIILPNVGLEEARTISERLRQRVESTTFSINTSGTPIQVTMSLGIACYPQDAMTLLELLHHADVAVYNAKTQGRNRVVSSTEVPYAFRLAGSLRLGEEQGVAS
jgi:diguanylate cyclase (GGDEF)-like protein